MNREKRDCPANEPLGRQAGQARRRLASEATADADRAEHVGVLRDTRTGGYIVEPMARHPIGASAIFGAPVIIHGRGRRGHNRVPRTARGVKMGLTITLEDERGTILARVEDPPNLLSRLLPGTEDASFYILRFIDRYGDTVINRLQLPVFLEEWDRIAQNAKGENERSFLARIRDLG